MADDRRIGISGLLVADMKPMVNAGPDATAFPYTGPAELRPVVQLALEAVVDPEMAMSIVDVGLVYGVTITNRKLHAVVTMKSCTPCVTGPC